jgi:hypothetical protein
LPTAESILFALAISDGAENFAALDAAYNCDAVRLEALIFAKRNK